MVSVGGEHAGIVANRRQLLFECIDRPLDRRTVVFKNDQSLVLGTERPECIEHQFLYAEITIESNSLQQVGPLTRATIRAPIK